MVFAQQASRRKMLRLHSALQLRRQQTAVISDATKPAVMPRCRAGCRFSRQPIFTIVTLASVIFTPWLLHAFFARLAAIFITELLMKVFAPIYAATPPGQRRFRRYFSLRQPSSPFRILLIFSRRIDISFH